MKAAAAEIWSEIARFQFVEMDELLYNKTFAVHAAAAAASVALGTAVTYPLDTLKVLIQVSNVHS